MRYEAYSGSPVAQRADCLVVGVFDDRSLGELGREADRALKGALTRLLKRGDFAGKSGESLLLPETGGRTRSVLLVGLGPHRGYDRRAWRKAFGTAVAALTRTRLASAASRSNAPPCANWATCSWPAPAPSCAARPCTASTTSSPRRSRANRRSPRCASDRSAAANWPPRAARWPRALAWPTAPRLLKDLANLPGNVCTPRYLANAALAAGRAIRGLKVRVFNEAQIRRLKMGSFLAVAQGSAEPPRFIVMEYRGGKRGAAPVVLVGKGITFDTGGISLKDPGRHGRDEVRHVRRGHRHRRAAVRRRAEAEAQRGRPGAHLREHARAAAPSKPGDIVTSASGQTIEILNTDAEGRLILCDALTYARRFKPDCVIDFATLTGACLIALGRVHSGLLANDQKLADELLAAGVGADDRAWQLPLTEEYGEMLRSNFADMANVAGREAGTITAAAFLGKYTQGMTLGAPGHRRHAPGSAAMPSRPRRGRCRC